MKSLWTKTTAAALALLLAASSSFGAGAEYYDHTTYPSQGSAGSSAAMRAELDLIEAGFGKLPTLTGNGGKITAINAGGTAIEAITTTGTGSGVRATSPTLVTPNLGTPSALVGTNITGTAAGLTVGNATNAVNATNATTATTATTVITNANLTGPITSTGNATAVAAQTGTGSVFVMQASPTLTTPNIGTPSAGDATNLTNTIAPQTHAASSKATPVDADELPLADSAASFALKRLTWANLKATLNGLFAASGANNDITSLSAITAGGYPALSVTPANLSQKFTLGTAVAASGSGSVSFTGIPSWANRVTIYVAGLSSNGTDNIYFQAGTSGGFVATGYLSGTTTTTNGSSIVSNETLGFGLTASTGVIATSVYNYTLTLRRLTGNTWVADGSGHRSDSAVGYIVNGNIALGAALDRIRVANQAAATFDAGTVNISYE